MVARLVATPRAVADTYATKRSRRSTGCFVRCPAGGPNGLGWPFGKPVQPGEMYAVLQRVRGVELVEDLRMFGADPVTGKRGSEVKRLDLDKHSLVFSFEHQVLVGEQ